MSDDRSTSMHISGRMNAALSQYHECNNTISIEPQAAVKLSEAFSSLSKQLANLNALILNGVPVQVNVTTPAPVNNIVVEKPINQVTVEPPVIQVQPPQVVVRPVAEPKIQIDNDIHNPAPYFSRDEVWALVAMAMIFLCVMSVGLVLIGVKFWSQ